MRSLRMRLTLSLAAGLGLLMLGGGLWINAVLSSRLLQEFDQVLMAKANALMALTELENDKIEFDFSDASLPQFSRIQHPDYFALWRAPGTLLKKSISLGAQNFSLEPGLNTAPQFDDVVLPNGLSGRRVQVAYAPFTDVAESDQADASETPNTEPQDDKADSEDQPERLAEQGLARTLASEPMAIMIVARERGQLDDLIRFLRVALAAGMLGFLIVMVVLVRLVVRIGLRPLDDVQQQVSRIDVDTLTTGVQVDTQTEELLSVVNQLNALMHRLGAGFERERQFSSDVAHELRTPLAELRTLAEVGGRWPDDREAVAEYFADVRAICEQMEGVVISLLTLTRCERGVQPIEAMPINLREAVEASWLTVTQLAQEKSQVFECAIESTQMVVSDRDMLVMVLRNLFGNAVLHSPPKSTIRCEVSNHGSRPRLTIRNAAENLATEDLPHLFERFWRKDAARSNGSHSGLGLAIVKAFSDLLGLDVELQMERHQILSVTLSL